MKFLKLLLLVSTIFSFVAIDAMFRAKYHKSKKAKSGQAAQQTVLEAREEQRGKLTRDYQLKGGTVRVRTVREGKPHIGLFTPTSGSPVDVRFLCVSNIDEVRGAEKALENVPAYKGKFNISRNDECLVFAHRNR